MPASLPKTIPNFFGGGIQGRSSYVTSQERLNCYIDYHTSEIFKDRDKALAIYGFPGETLFTAFGGSFPVRGLYSLGNSLYAVIGGTFYQINNAGQVTQIGTLQTTLGKVAMQDNGNGNQLVLADGQAGYVWNTSTLTFSTISDINFPNTTLTLTFQDTYIIAVGPTPNTFALSAPGNALSWTPVLQGVAESGSGILKSVKSVNSNLMIMGDKYTEWWQDTGALNFPFQRIPGAASNWGIAAINSFQLFDNTAVYLARTPEGAVTVARVNGLVLEPISTPELDYLLNIYPTVADATSFTFRYGGHSFYQLNFPSAVPSASWVYDAKTHLWSSAQSGVVPARSNRELSATLINTTYVTDNALGNIYKLDSANYSENGATYIRELISRHVFVDDRTVVFNRLQIDMETGVGINLGQGSAPQLITSISKDGGHTWLPEIWIPLGALGVFKQRALLQRLGRGRDWTFKLRLSDPCAFIIVDATANVSVGLQ